MAGWSSTKLILTQFAVIKTLTKVFYLFLLNFVVSIFFTITEIEYQYVKTHFNLCFLQYTPRNNSMPTQDTPHLKPTQARTTTDPSTDRTTTEHVTR